MSRSRKVEEKTRARSEGKTEGGSLPTKPKKAESLRKTKIIFPKSSVQQRGIKYACMESIILATLQKQKELYILEDSKLTTTTTTKYFGERDD